MLLKIYMWDFALISCPIRQAAASVEAPTTEAQPQGNPVGSDSSSDKVRRATKTRVAVPWGWQLREGD